MEKKRRLRQKAPAAGERASVEGIDGGIPAGAGTAHRRPPARRSDQPKCAGLKDPLGDFSEQTGSFFG